MNLSILSSEEILSKLRQHAYDQKKTYLAMYSSWFGGITKDPSLMLVPVDDHLVHRGDGVFEAARFTQGSIYLLKDHLDRLQISADQLGLNWPFSRTELTDILHQTVQASGSDEAMIRIYLSRGPGGFTTNPYESVGTQVYVVVTHFKPMPDAKYLDGVKIGKSNVTPKDPWFAKIKSCNYLPNVLMKKEAVDRKIDFTIGFDAAGILTESSTENIMLLDKDNSLVRPKLRQILKGTTMMRVLHLAEDLVARKQVHGIIEKDLNETDLRSAKEVMMVGTTLDVLPVTEYEGQPIADGNVGILAPMLRELLRQDMKS